MATHNPINILEAFAAAPPPLDYVLPNMVAGTVGALVSPGGAGKSMLALQLAAQIAGGPDLLGVGELPTGPVIYLPAEDPPTAIHHRLHALGAHLSAEERQAVADGLLIQPLIGSLPNIMASNWFEALKRAAEGRRLMILDTLRRFHIEEENASGPMAQVIGRMEAIAAEELTAENVGKYQVFTENGKIYVSYINGVPESATVSLSLLGLAALMLRRRR
nr:AAA family ATPase [Akkermansia sp.]